MSDNDMISDYDNDKKLSNFVPKERWDDYVDSCNGAPWAEYALCNRHFILAMKEVLEISKNNPEEAIEKLTKLLDNRIDFHNSIETPEGDKIQRGGPL